MDSKYIHIKNEDLVTVLAWTNVPLHSEEARARNRCHKAIQEVYNVYETKRMELVTKYSEKETDGSIKKAEDGSKNAKMSEENLKAFTEEFASVKLEIASFEVTKENKADWLIFRNIFERTQVSMDVDTTEIYNEILAAFDTALN